jgi:deoxyribonuclease V
MEESPEFDRSITPEEAIKLQLVLRERCIIAQVLDDSHIDSVAGADATYVGDIVYAAVVSLSLPDLETIECQWVEERVEFPYIPGLLAFREGPALLSACRMLSEKPDMWFFDGHGIAHPRRFGLASHMGVLLDQPSIGVAKEPLGGTLVTIPPDHQGETSPVKDGEELIGMAVRTVKGQKPVYVSPGHKTDLAQAVRITLASLGKSRIPAPLHEAHLLSREIRLQMRPDAADRT